MQKLDATVLREFIDHIEVYHADKKTRHGRSPLFITLSVHLILHGLRKKPKIQSNNGKERHSL